MKEAEGDYRGTGAMSLETGTGVICFESGGRGLKRRNADTLGAEQDEETDSSLAPPGGSSPAGTLILAP